jgi:hypothetical protein
LDFGLVAYLLSTLAFCETWQIASIGKDSRNLIIFTERSAVLNDKLVLFCGFPQPFWLIQTWENLSVLNPHQIR